MSEANQALDVGSAATPAAAVQQLQHGLSKAPRTLWGDAWRRFRRHKLAIVGTFVLIFFAITVAIGPPLYVSWRVGQTTLAPSARTWRMNSPGLVLAMLFVLAN